MSQDKTEIELAWEEVSFWQDYLKWWRIEHKEPPEPRVAEALEKAWQRYESALHLGKREG